MTKRSDPYDTTALQLTPEEAARVRIVKVEREPRSKRLFTQFPVAWEDRMRECRCGSTYRVVLFVLHRYWWTKGKPVLCSNVALAECGVRRHAKWRALRELEQLGLIRTESRVRQSPLVHVLIDNSRS